jgi:hypothetical protein
MIRNKNDYVTTAEAAEMLGFGPDHIRKLIYQKKINPKDIAKIGRNLIIKISGLKNIKRQRFPRGQNDSSK